MLELCDPFGWHEVDQLTLHKIRERLKAFETMTWGEILNEGGKRNHFIDVKDLDKSAKERLKLLKQDDVDQVLSLGLTARGRILGILENSILRLLWWDPHHSACRSYKKHT